jgi:hypothetical protein
MVNLKYIQLLLVLSILFSCKSQRLSKEISQKEACVFLWMETNKPCAGSMGDIKKYLTLGAEIDFIHPYESLKTTPFLNASGMLERLKDRDRHTDIQIHSMEKEAVKIVKYLAKKGANIHATVGDVKLNALHLAANGGREKMIPVLVDLGLDINSRNGDPDYGGTVLWHAINAGDLATVKAVVEAGADINLCLLDGNSPLDWAEAYANPKAEEALWLVPYRDQKSIAEYMQSIGAKHGKNQFKGMLYFDESKVNH